MRDETTPEQLKSLEAILEIASGYDEFDAELAAKVNRLIREKERSQMPTVGRLKQLVFGRQALREQERRQCLIGLRHEATQRATRILVAIRRHKLTTGVWPESLEQVELKLSADTPIDPWKDYRFVYGRDRDRFFFEIKGPYRVDEHGSYSGPGDVWRIWP